MAIDIHTTRNGDIQQAYDLVMAALDADPNRLQGGSDAHENAVIAIEDTLRKAASPLVGNAGALMTSRKAAIARQKTTPVDVGSATAAAVALAQEALGGQPLVGASQGVAEASTPDAATASVATSVDPLIAAITGTTLGIAQIVAIRDRLADTAARAAQATDLADPIFGEAKAMSGALSGVPAKHPMIAAVDTLLASALPGVTWNGLLDSVADSERAIVDAEKALRANRIVAAAPVHAPTTPATPTEHRMTEPTIQTTIVARTAKEIFTQAYGAVDKLLAFQVPTMVHDQPHPGVPEVDPTYKFYTPVLVEALQTIADNEIMWLYGDSGCGKSEFWKQLAAKLNMPFTRLNMDGHLTRGDIIGVNRMVPNADKQMEMRFVDGILPRAMAQPGLLLIDELDLGDPEIMAVLQPVLEGEPLRILEDHGRVVAPHPHFRIAVTGNTIGLGSDSNAYVNAFEQSAATRDRIASYVKMPYLTPEMEKQVIMARIPGINEAFVVKLIQLANKVREGYAQGEINQIFSMRSTQAAAKRALRFQGLYPEEGQMVATILENVVLNRMDSSSRNVVKGFIDAIFA
jgi:cobaltochelatase CobS